MRQIEGRPLWLGNAGDLREPTAIVDAGIEAVIELADSEPAANLPRELIRSRFPLSDGGDNSPATLRLAAETTASLLRARVPTLVCCSAGMSRSICVAASGLALAEDRSLLDALRVAIGTGPADVSPGLLEQMHRALIGQRMCGNG